MARTEASVDTGSRIATTRSRIVSYRERLPTLSDVLALDSFGRYLQIVKMMDPFPSTVQLDIFRQLDAAKGTGNSARAKALREEIILRNLGLPISIAKKYRGHGVKIEDLVPHGNLGLIDAVDTFDVSRGNEFSTPATFLIRKEIQDAIADMGSSAFRVPYHMRSRMRDVIIMRGDLTLASRGIKPTDEEVAVRIGSTAQRVANSDRAMAKLKSYSLDKTSDAENGYRCLSETVADIDQPDTIDVAIYNVRLKAVVKAMSHLPPLQYDVLCAKVGLLDGEVRTWQQIADSIGVSEGTATNIFKAALHALRDELGGVALVELFSRAGAKEKSSGH